MATMEEKQQEYWAMMDEEQSVTESNDYEVYTDMQLQDLWALAIAERDWTRLRSLATEMKRRANGESDGKR